MLPGDGRNYSARARVLALPSSYRMSSVNSHNLSVLHFLIYQRSLHSEPCCEGSVWQHFRGPGTLSGSQYKPLESSLSLHHPLIKPVPPPKKKKPRSETVLTSSVFNALASFESAKNEELRSHHRTTVLQSNLQMAHPGNPPASTPM